MGKIKNTDKTAAVREMIEQLLLAKYEVAADIVLTDKDLAAFRGALEQNRDAAKLIAIRQGIDLLLDKKSISERGINALSNNIDYYTSMLTKVKGK